MNSKLNLAPRVDSETETDSSKYAAKEYNRCTDKVKNTLKQEIYHFYFHLTHILEISRFEVPISRFFWAFFQPLQICMVWSLAGLLPYGMAIVDNLCDSFQVISGTGDSFYGF